MAIAFIGRDGPGDHARVPEATADGPAFNHDKAVAAAARQAADQEPA
jgi:hypothetical protein